jgi:hypothetical protein
MAAGDLISADHQYEYNGLLVGSGTNFWVESWDGLFDATNINISDLTPIDRDGVIPGLDTMGKRVITGKLHLLNYDGQSSVYDDIEAFGTAFMPRRSTELPLVYQLPGGRLRYVNCRVRKRSMPKDADLFHGHGNINLQLEASDPRHYELDASDNDTTLAAGEAAGSILIDNEGNYFVEPVITISNTQLTNPIITMVSQDPIDPYMDTTGFAIRLNCTITPTDVLVIDVKNKIITLNGEDAYDFKRTDSQWWTLMPGINNISINRDAGTVALAADVVFEWNAGWIY